MQQRYYDPAIGRFLGNDPVSTDTKTGGNFSRYSYANSNPYRFTDPDGRKAKAMDGPKGTTRVTEPGTETPLYTKDAAGNDQPNAEAFNCHSDSWNEGQGDPTDPANSDSHPKYDNSVKNQVEKARANGKQLDSNEANRPGDVLVYGTDRNENGTLDGIELTAGDVHSAKVESVDSEGNSTRVRSKEGPLGVTTHHPFDQNSTYGNFIEWYRP